MFDPISNWNRLMAASISMMNTNFRAIEMLTASGEVIAARTSIMGAAISAPLLANNAELSRMVPEKIKAFSRAGSAWAKAGREAQSAWLEYTQSVGCMTMRNGPPKSREFVELAGKTITMATDSIEAFAKLGSNSLAPIHRQTTANAKRLRRKR